jgi:hypothetical protein
MIAILVAVSLLSSPQVPERVPAIANAETCIRENSAAAVAASNGAADAASFLLDYLCATAVQKAANWQINTDILVAMKSISEGISSEQADLEMADVDDGGSQASTPFTTLIGDIDDVSVDPISGEFTTAGTPDSLMLTTLRSQSTAYSQVAGNKSPAFLRELAAQVVLQQRSQR